MSERFSPGDEDGAGRTCVGAYYVYKRGTVYVAEEGEAETRLAAKRHPSKPPKVAGLVRHRVTVWDKQKTPDKTPAPELPETEHLIDTAMQWRIATKSGASERRMEAFDEMCRELDKLIDRRRGM